MIRDVRFAFRVLLSRPLFTLVAAVSLALGIGANSAIFSLVDAFWFRPLAVPRSGDIVRLFSITDQDSHAWFSYPEFLDLERQATKLSDVVAIGGRGASVIGMFTVCAHDPSVATVTACSTRPKPVSSAAIVYWPGVSVTP